MCIRDSIIVSINCVELLIMNAGRPIIVVIAIEIQASWATPKIWFSGLQCIVIGVTNIYFVHFIFVL